MDLIKQISELHNEDKHREIIFLIDKEINKTPELVSIMARAYNNLGEYKKAEELLLSIAKTEENTAVFNYRLGYSYIYLDKEYKAIEYLEKAIKFDESFREDCTELLEICYNSLNLPNFDKTFNKRVAEFWQEFSKIEAELCTRIDNKEYGDDLFTLIETATDKFLEKVYVEVGKNDKYEMILALDGEFHRVFLYNYIIKNMPEELLEKWRFLIGRQPMDGFGLRMNDREVNAEDIIIRIDNNTENSIEITLYSEKLQDAENKAHMMILMLETVLGEITCFKILTNTEFSDDKIDGIPLSELPEKLKSMGINIENNQSRILEEYSSYKMEPSSDEDAPARADIFVGVTQFIPLLNDFFAGEDFIVNSLHDFGATAGYLFFDAYAFENKSKDTTTFRYKIEDEIMEKAGNLGVIIGGATGTNFSYIDFIAYDTRAFIEVAIEVFEENDIDFAVFSSFRNNSQALRIV